MYDPISSPSFMLAALQQAQLACVANEVPVGAALVCEGNVIAQAHNRVEAGYDPSAHAEMLVIRQGCGLLKSPRLPECDLYVTLEPCPMCAQAISFARIRRLYFGAYDMKGGGVEHGPRIFQQPSCHHAPEIYGGVMEQECARLLTSFFRAKR